MGESLENAVAEFGTLTGTGRSAAGGVVVDVVEVVNVVEVADSGEVVDGVEASEAAVGVAKVVAPMGASTPGVLLWIAVGEAALGVAVVSALAVVGTAELVFVMIWTTRGRGVRAGSAARAVGSDFAESSTGGTGAGI